MNTPNKTCPNCGHSLEDNSSSLICMNCGCSITPEKKFDNVDAQKTAKKNENATNIFFSLGSLWWGILIVGCIISSIVSIVLLLGFL